MTDDETPMVADHTMPQTTDPVARAIRLWRKHWLWSVIAAAAVSGAVLGFWGFAIYFRNAGEPRPFVDLVYFVLHLFVIEAGEADGPVPWQLQVARLVAPLATAGALVKACVVIFHEQAKALRLRFIDSHTVICGLGRKGLQLVQDCCAAGERVVVIESDDQNDRIRLARDLGAIILTGDASQESMLRKARVERARYVVAVCGGDGTNVEIAVHCHELVHRNEPGRARFVQCYVHVVDLELCRLLRRHPIFMTTSDRFELALFNTYENAARTVLKQHPLDYQPISPDDPRGVHLVVLGFGQMGQSMALETAKTAHYANGQKPRVTIVDRTAHAKRQVFLSRFPYFDKACDIEFVQAEADSPEVLEQLSRWVDDADSLTTLAVCMDDESCCLSSALAVASKLAPSRVPILVRMGEEAGLATLLDHSAMATAAEAPQSAKAGSLFPFGMVGRSSSRDLLLSEELDRLARTIHENYVRKRQAEEGFQPDEATLPWKKLGHDLRESNRQQADHIPVKLRAIASASSGDPMDGEVIDHFKEPAEVDLLARMEHARWSAERHLAGWTWSLSPKDVVKRTNPSLVTWEELDEPTREFDRAAVREIPRLLESLGERIYRSIR